MSSTWILVADEDGARVYETRAGGDGMRVVRELPPRAAPKVPPRGFVISLAAGREEDDTLPVRPTRPIPPDHGRFARELAWLLGRAREERFFQRLVLVAPPAMLGSIRRELDGPTRALVAREIEGEVEGDGALDLPRALAGA